MWKRDSNEPAPETRTKSTKQRLSSQNQPQTNSGPARENNKINYAVGIIIWHEYYLQGRWIESPFAQETRAILNTLWQAFKNDLGPGSQWIESEQGAHLHYATSSVRSKRDHVPLIQITMDENSQDRGDPTCWVFTPAEYQSKDKNIGIIKKKFQAKWAEYRNTALENHKKRVEQQRAQHSDPLIPNLSQLVPHTNLKDVQTGPQIIGMSNSELWRTSGIHAPNFGTKQYCWQKQSNLKTIRKEKEPQRVRENQQTATKTTTIGHLYCYTFIATPILLHRYCYTDPISTLQQFAARICVSAREVLCHSSRKRRNAVVIVFLLHSVSGSSPVAKSPRAHTPHCAFRLSPVISELW